MQNLHKKAFCNISESSNMKQSYLFCYLSRQNFVCGLKVPTSPLSTQSPHTETIFCFKSDTIVHSVEGLEWMEHKRQQGPLKTTFTDKLTSVRIYQSKSILFSLEFSQ